MTGVSDEPTVWGAIDGRQIVFPMEVPEFHAATLLFSVPAAAAAALLPGDDFEVIEVAPGTAQFVVAACDYLRNPWGDYRELNLGFLARPTGGRGEDGSFVYRMPVDQEFTCKAGNEVMGFPKTVEVIDTTYGDDTVTFSLTMGGHPTLTLRLPRAEPAGAPTRIDAVSYSYLRGVPYATTLSMDMGTGVVDPADVVVEVGEGPVADELRSLGLPKAPDMATWGEGLSATFHLGRPV